MRQNENLNHLIELNFQVINRLFVFSLENDSQRTSSKIYYLPNVEIKDYNVVIDGKNQSANKKNDKITYENFRKIAIGPEDDCATDCLLNCPYFKNKYKTITIDISKQQALDAHPRAIQQTNFTANLDQVGDIIMFFILEEKNCFGLFTRNC